MDEPLANQPEPFAPHHTTAQKLLLALNILVVLACVIGATVLVIGKRELDDTLAAPAVGVVSTVSAQTTLATPGTGDEPDATVSTAVPVTFPPADPQAQNFLITGSDANACVDPDSPWAGAADPLAKPSATAATASW